MMKWSVSKAKLFQTCQRKWYYSDILAHWRPKKGTPRRNAYDLKHLQSIQAWRGSLVDKVIEKRIILPIMFNNFVPDERSVISYAMQLADRQLEFGTKKKYLEEGMTQTKAGDDYAAFFDVEYNGGLKAEDISKAKEEIKLALHNLYAASIFNELTKTGIKLVAQRDLMISINGFCVTAKPDLIIFNDINPPHIIDWKVHEGRHTDYWQQLSVYAFVLSKIKPHKDFPQSFVDACHKAQSYAVTEFQLLQNKAKPYTLTDKDIEDAEDLIHLTGSVMQDMYNDRESLDASSCSTARYESTCISCQFRRLCWEGDSHVEN
jgi:CRISPR/Cas system-associated exonuclease Cas4 (RecB family)